MKSLNVERKKKSKCCCTLYDKEGLQRFPEKNWYSIIYGKNAETTKLGTRDKRDFVPPCCKAETRLFLFVFVFVFLTGVETVNVFSVFPFLFHKMEHILTSLNIN